MPRPTTTTVSTKGQVILPKAIRDQRHWGAGTQLIVEETAEGVLLRPVPVFAPTRLVNVIGMLQSSHGPLSVEDMDNVIAQEARRRARD